MAKKIMFNDRYGLTQAVLDGRKTMTRRLVPEGTPYGCWRETVKRSRYRAGEIIAIAQSYRDVAQGGYPVDARYDAFRSANWGDGEDGALRSSAGWNNKMFVKSELIPHHIRITNVRVERLQDISDIECFREGIKDYSTPTEKRYGYSDFVRETIVSFKTPHEAFASLIDKVSGKGTWESNHFVFAYEFELVD